MSKPKKSKPKKVVYIITATEFGGLYKIGIANDMKKRMKALQTACPYKLFSVGCYKVHKPATVEKMIHLIFHKKRIQGEWFRLLQIDIVHIDNFVKPFLVMDKHEI
jgi:hypothetical protein